MAQHPEETVQQVRLEHCQLLAVVVVGFITTMQVILAEVAVEALALDPDKIQPMSDKAHTVKATPEEQVDIQADIMYQVAVEVELLKRVNQV